MALGNLSIKVNADIGGFTTNMDIASESAQSSMVASAGSVEQMRASLLQASADMQKAAMAMGGNMAAANDAITSSSAQSAAAITSSAAHSAEAITSSAVQSAEAIQFISDAADQVQFTSMGEKIAFGVGSGMGAGFSAVSTWMDTVEEFVKTKLVMVGIAIAAGVTLGAVSAIYTAYKLIGALSSMMDGSFYKSDNIDSLIASNNELVDLQKNLRISSIEAGALNETFKRLGVDAGDYKAVYAGIDSAIRANGDELDRLGVKYKGANGALLENRQVMENAKSVLDTYTEGWDRTQAAAAMGIGSYEKITNALKVTSAEVQKSKERLDDYQLGMTSGTQEMVTKYETAMREFDRENDLAAQGFKRVYADAVMPLYTDMANMMKEGWPSIVRATRIGVSSVVALFYGLKDGVYIAYESIHASLDAISSAVIGLGAGMARLASGDVKGAGEALSLGWEMAKDRIKLAGDNIVAQVMENDRKIRLATADDGRDASIQSVKLPPVKKLKDWTPAPEAAESQVDDVAKRIMEGALKEQEAAIGRERAQLQNHDQFLKFYYNDHALTVETYYDSVDAARKKALAAELAAYDKELAALVIYKAAALKPSDKIDADTRMAEVRKKSSAAIAAADAAETMSLLEKNKIYSDFDRASVEWTRQQEKLNDQARFATGLLGANTTAAAILTEQRRIDIDVNERLYQARLKGLSLSDQEIADLFARADAQKAAAALLIQASDAKQKDGWFGAGEAIRKYGEAAANTGGQIESAMTRAFSASEDALTKFLMTGKASFSGFAQSVMADMARIEAKNLMASIMGKGGGSSILGSLFSIGLGAAGAAGGAASAASAASAVNYSLGSGVSSSSGMLGRGLSGARVLGGPVNAGESYLVGEKGQEIFTPSAGGTIIPNDKLGGGGGANVSYAPVIHIDARTDQAEVYRLVTSAVAQGNANLVDQLQRAGML